MLPELKKASPVRLKSLGLDEKWLQERIVDDPSLLGLGDLQIIQRERSQPTGGRIDFLMYEPDEHVRYEVEIMLGTLDESHIIRTIEYWDIERQRYPSFEHVAVIVAEEITSRFFNVIGLLNRAVPIIALQLNAFHFDSSIVLHFTKVLDIHEASHEEDESAGEQTDRLYWERRANAKSLSIVDSIVSLIPKEKAPPRVTYNKGHIAVGTSGRNFCWFHPRKQASHCHVQFRATKDERDAIIKRLEEFGIEASHHRQHSFSFQLSTKDLTENVKQLEEIVSQCEVWSRD